jgi:hypothetical protein
VSAWSSAREREEGDDGRGRLGRVSVAGLRERAWMTARDWAARCWVRGEGEVSTR